MNAGSIKIETDENGFTLRVDFYNGFTVYRISDPEAFYDHVKAAILLWLMECDVAKIDHDRARRSADTRSLTDEEFSAYVDDAYGDDFSKHVGMEQMREQAYA
jgi:hypothetical protein